MFSLFGLRKDSKKTTTEREADGGFVIIGETVEDRRRKMQTMHITQPSTNVIVQPSKFSGTAPAPPINPRLPTVCHPAMPVPMPLAADVSSSLPDLLGDIPFTLAPHVMAVQEGYSLIPDVLLSRDVDYNLANFQYDFTLENSVIRNS
ncbi:UBAP1-MVB12-associated (UMA)-domain containing protein 1 [Thalassophryne amazonica]|uniref:UBAP1-MVB12-associated (UMA)-domain containing protein 1 n=1 Tax=Thalassophryne amazonica TaxID=390379 RepID=UPI0014709D37|nr:UBAP1-MVB12-associated (UMA)-domain containing protein 1 [Thalassophryne amazonica]